MVKNNQQVDFCFHSGRIIDYGKGCPLVMRGPDRRTAIWGGLLQGSTTSLEKSKNNFSKRKKYKYLLPSYYKLTNIRFDLERLQNEVRQLEEQFTSVTESNQELCSNNHLLVESVYDHYEQVSLTTIDRETPVSLSTEECSALGESAGVENQLSKHRKYFLKTQCRSDFPALDERNYNKPTEAYLGSYIQECVESFNQKIMRVRLVKLKSGKNVDWHIDYDPSYAMRFIIPIFTNENVINKTKRRNEIESLHLEADGHPWFLNTGFSHSVENNGDTDRVVLMFSLDAPDLLEQAVRDWEENRGTKDSPLP